MGELSSTKELLKVSVEMKLYDIRIKLDSWINKPIYEDALFGMLTLKTKCLLV